ncbi:hypothetical protein [Helicobacter sp. 11S02629-2]|uniref:hypothetical protein n=1 Tax=Helicobacter sp. 11S02629-2 TaxID=1476195 RepID=UPI000BA6DF9C|nr:hypothetical protein [Helicobacter sp. 11S02629-2]PAF45510.1 hypothetical protein BKH40_03355 [Helicobacter sp. 11S02629-2]
MHLSLRSICFSAFIALFFIACDMHSAYINNAYDANNFQNTYKKTLAAQSDKTNALLWTMQEGYLDFAWGGGFYSIPTLDRAEGLFNERVKSGLLVGALENVGATLSNDLAIPYTGYFFEGSLLNLYKALAFVQVGDYADARVEFNRANDRQRMASDYYAKEIRKAQLKQLKDADKEASKNGETSVVAPSTRDKEIVGIINKNYSNIFGFEVYKNLINPSVSYLSGLFFLQVGDYSKSIDLLKEAYGITKAKTILDDMQLLEDRRLGKDSSHYTWIVIDDGDIVRKASLSIRPLLFTPTGLVGVSFVLPSMKGKDGKDAFLHYKVDSKNIEVITNLSSLFISEFKKQLPLIITRAMISTISKLAISQSMTIVGNNQSIPLLSIAGTISTLAFQASSTADTRSSTFLPNRTLVARIKNSDFNASDANITGDGRLLLKLHFSSMEDCTPSYFFASTTKDRPLTLDEAFKNFKALKQKERSKILLNNFKAKKSDTLTLCSKSDNIVYIRAKNNITNHFIIKGK